MSYDDVKLWCNNNNYCLVVVKEEIKIEPNMSMHLWNLKKADWKEFKENSQYYITDGVIVDDNNDTFKNIVESFTLLANETLHCKKIIIMPKHIRNIDPFHSGISNALKPFIIEIELEIKQLNQRSYKII